MTQRTHDLAAVAFTSYFFLTYPPYTLNWETLLGIGVATFLGGLIPDIDNVASPAWKHKLMPWEGKATREFLEGHRHISHSLLGLVIFYWIFGWLLKLVPLAHLEINVIQTAFLLGHLSHLVMDSLTIQGVPWLYPLPFKFGFPPFKFLRVKTGGWVEKIVVFPLLLAFTIWIYYVYRSNLHFFIKI